MRIRHKSPFLAALLLLFVVPLPALQDPAPQAPAISVKVKVVSLLATVRDKHGQIIPNLTKDDFTLTEDGRPQAITFFSRETDLPLTLGLLVDTSYSQMRVLDEERAASYTFLDEMLRKNKDQAFLIHFDFEIELLQDITSSHKQLGDALGLLQMPKPRDNNGTGSAPGGHRGRHANGGSGTALYDAVYLASNEVTRLQEGRKALIILSDGVDQGSKVSLATAIESAQRADTVVYSILFADEQFYDGFGGFGGGWPGRHGGGPRFPESRPDGKKILEKLAKETGGRMFRVSKKETVEKVYSQIEDELRSQYSIGYAPDKDARSGYRKIRLNVKEKNDVVQARDGYYAE